MTNTTGALHILTGTYELLPLRNLNGQAARRGLEIHFPRYQFQHEPDQQTFQRTLLTLLQQIPLKVEIKPLVDQWSYFYERCIGCIGVLKDWLVRALAAALTTGQSELLLERIQECALPIAQCESMALEAAAGEQELHYTASRQQHLWALLGMKLDQDVIQQQVQPIPVEAVQPLPDEATTRQKSRVGEQQPSALRWENPKKKGVRRIVLFLGQSWSFSQHRSERQEWKNSCVRRAEQPERRRFGANSSSIPLTHRCALHVRTKARCGSGKGQPEPRGSEEHRVHSSLVWGARTN